MCASVNRKNKPIVTTSTDCIQALLSALSEIFFGENRIKLLQSIEYRYRDN